MKQLNNIVKLHKSTQWYKQLSGQKCWKTYNNFFRDHLVPKSVNGKERGNFTRLGPTHQQPGNVKSPAQNNRQHTSLLWPTHQQPGNMKSPAQNNRQHTYTSRTYTSATRQREVTSTKQQTTHVHFSDLHISNQATWSHQHKTTDNTRTLLVVEKVTKRHMPFHLMQINKPYLNPRQIGWCSIYLPRRDGRLCRPWRWVIYWHGLPSLQTVTPSSTNHLTATQPRVKLTTSWS